MRCAGCPFNTPIVTSPEIKPADLMIIGEAPGKTEVKVGKCFVGPSGRLLDQTLKSFGIKRDDCAVTNALCCYIPDYLYAKKATYVQEPVQFCRGRLMEEIAIVKPKAIIAMGNVAMHALLQDFGLKITQERGKAMKFSAPEVGIVDVHFMSTLHPAAVLRNPNDYKKFRRDMAYVHHLAKGGEPKSPGETHYEVIYEPGPECSAAIDNLITTATKESQGVVAADIETDSLDPITGDILALGIAYAPNRVTIFRRPCLSSLGDLLDSKSLSWVWHNGKFDTKFLQRWNLPARVDHDTMLLHYATEEQKGTHDLKQLSTYLLGASDYSTEFKTFLPERGMTFADAPDDALHTYLSKDCDYTYQIFQQLQPQVYGQTDLRFLYENLLIPFSHFLLNVEERGIWINPEYVDKLEVELVAEAEGINERIQELAEPYWDELDYAFETKKGKVPDGFNPASVQQLKWLLYTSMELRPGNGQTDTSRETLETIEGSAFVDAILELRKNQKKLGTYVRGMKEAVKKDGRVHATYLIHGTMTGRLSSSDPNMQNIPRDKGIKDIFQAPEGRFLIDMDLAQAELRMLAVMSEDEVLKAVFESGRDLHSETAHLIFGPGFTKEDRVRSKSVNFGIIYGLTEYSLQMSFGITWQEAHNMIAGWAKAYPKAWEFLQGLRKIPLEGRYATSPFGRRRRFPLVTKDSLNGLQNEASNFAIQATASDINVLTAMALDEKISGLDSFVINLVHDSTIVECPDNPDVVRKIVNLAQATLDETVKSWLKTEVPFELSGDYGKAWGSTKPLRVYDLDKNYLGDFMHDKNGQTLFTDKDDDKIRVIRPVTEVLVAS